jgi:hypothetical protein
MAARMPAFPESTPIVRHIRTAAAAAFACVLVVSASAPVPEAQDEIRGAVPIAARSVGEIRQWAPVVEGMMRAGELRLRPRRPDLVMASRRHDRADQYHRGVRVDARTGAVIFLFKRFNRQGLDNGNIRILSIVHPARREDLFTPLGSDPDRSRSSVDAGGVQGGVGLRFAF